MFLYFLFPFLCVFSFSHAEPKIQVGIDRLMDKDFASLLKGKKVGLITNHTGVNGSLQSTISILKSNAKNKNFTLVALFAPEHGLNGSAYAFETINDLKDRDNLPIYSLHGATRRPTEAMLKNIDVLIFDIQDLGSRSYTYVNTMFYAMEEAAKYNITFLVLDRPNPLNGITVDGLLLEEKWRSFLGYINIPYCHGMTIGELALFFNQEYKVGCKVEIVPMKGWHREMSFQETGLNWIPTSPNIPEATTAYFYPTTGILGDLQFVNIGIGYTLPFKIIGAPWINGDDFAKQLNAQKFPGVHFQPFHYCPMFGLYAKENCQGVLIVITDPKKFKPMSTQFLLLGMLKTLYPSHFTKAIETAKVRKEMLCKLNGTEEVYNLIVNEKYIIWKLMALHDKEMKVFLEKRSKYLIKSYFK